MIKLNVYLNFLGRTEEAFNFYKSVFGGEFTTFQRFKDVPSLPEKEKMTSADLEKIMHVALAIGNDVLMGTDAMESLGQTLTIGDNVNLSLHPDSKEEADRLFAALSAGGKITMPLMVMFWGGYFGTLEDAFGVRWMFNVEPKK